ncbi:MAG: hypothetical protein AB7F98_00955 [Novosphingobium sp.]
MNETEALLLSAAIEAPVAGLAVLLARWPCRGAVHVAAASAAATAVTHPQLWWAVLWAAEFWPRWLAVALPETVVVLIEGALIGWIAQMRLHQAMLASLLANAASLLAGLLIQG